MKLAILIAGYLRSLETNLDFLKKHIIQNNDVDIYFYKSKDESKDKYNNNSDWENIKTRLNIKIIIESNILYFDKNVKKNNILNQFYKFYILNNMKNDVEKNENIKYDIIIKWRPDILIHESIDFSNIEKDKIYIPENSMIDTNKLINKDDKHMCDIIAYGSSFCMNNYFNFFIEIENIINQYGCCQETLLYHYIHNNKIKHKYVQIKFSVVLSTCNIISISGNSGSGKTTLSQYLKEDVKNSFILECDRYHKWERNDPNWKKLTHLNPDANYITKMKNDIFDLKIGNDIYQVDYDHKTGKFTDKEFIESKQSVIVCGLHSLYDTNSDITIFMDTMENLNKIWKIKRDIKKRGYSVEKVLKQIDDRKNDYKKYILPQKDNADIIINFYTDNTIDFKDLNMEYEINLRVYIKKKYDIQNVIDALNSNKYDLNTTNLYYIFKFYDDIHYDLIHTIIKNLR